MQDAPDVHLGAEHAALRRELLPKQQHQLRSTRTRFILRTAHQMDEKAAGSQSSLERRPLIYRLGAHCHHAAIDYRTIEIGDRTSMPCDRPYTESVGSPP